MNTIHYKYWTSEDVVALARAGTSLQAMLDVALNVLSRMPPEVHFVAGRLTSGGGSTEDNFFVFRRTIEYLHKHEELNIFSQMPFEIGMIAFHKQWIMEHGESEYCWPILFEFYQKLFATKRFVKFHFIHGYRESTGASWEHEQCDVHGIARRYLSRELTNLLMREKALLPAIKD